MRRKQITQITNTSWCPKLFKKLVAEFLSWFVLKVNATKPFLPIINEVLKDFNTKNLINLDVGIGAGMEAVLPFLGRDISVQSIPFSNFDTTRSGVYTFINAFHQLNKNEAEKSLKEIAQSGNPVVIVEGNNDSLWQIVGMTFFVPLTVLLTAPFVKPFRLSRIIFTYFIPVLPIIIVIDGCLALMKLYNPDDLRELVSNLDIPDYTWSIGKKDNGRGGKIIYLKGTKV